MKLCGIYRIKNKINDLIYIGSSINIEQRWKTHKRELRTKRHHNRYLQDDWHKYGEENFIFEIIEIVEDRDKLIEREQYFMDLTKCYDLKNGYNINTKADNCLGAKRTKEEKEWLSKINSGEKSNWAKIKEKDAIDICKRLVCGESIKSIAKDYTCGIVSTIKKGSSWRHISKDYINYFSKNNSPYLFSGLIKCLDCSQNYMGKMERSVTVYICSGYNNKKSNCTRFAIKEKDILESIRIHFKSDVIDLNLIKSITVESKTVKINYTDGSYSILPPSR